MTIILYIYMQIFTTGGSRLWEMDTIGETSVLKLVEIGETSVLKLVEIGETSVLKLVLFLSEKASTLQLEELAARGSKFL